MDLIGEGLHRQTDPVVGGSALRVIFPMWGFAPQQFWRMEALLKSVAAHVELEIFHPQDKTPPEVPWANFKDVDPLCNLQRIDQTLAYAQHIVMKMADFDVLYCFSGGPHFQLLYGFIAHMAKKPAVMHLNGNGALARTYALGPYECAAQDALDVTSLNMMHAIVPISSNLEGIIRAKVSNPDRVMAPIPTSVDTDYFIPTELPRELVIGYGGRLSPEKGTGFLKDLMALTSDVRYRIAGPIQTDFTFPENCHYMGELRYQDMTNFYGGASVVILPSWGEGLSGNILEAYSCGRPVIVSPQAHPPELEVHGWELPLDLGAWVELIHSLEKGDLTEKGAMARAYIKKWPTWAEYGEKLKQVFIQCSDNSPLESYAGSYPQKR